MTLTFLGGARSHDWDSPILKESLDSVTLTTDVLWTRSSGMKMIISTFNQKNEFTYGRKFFRSNLKIKDKVLF